MAGRSIFLIPLLALLALGAATPLVGASTLKVVVGKSLRTAEIVATSQTQLVLTYPAKSFLSTLLAGFNYSVELNATNVPPDSDAFRIFQHELRRGFQNLTLINMSVDLSETAHANATSLVVVKTVVIQAWATGIFNKTNSKVEGDFGWKDFVVDGNLDVDFHGRMVDVNTVGSALMFPLGGNVLVDSMVHLFGGEPIWSASTINFSAFSTPLSQWSRSYNSQTNTTTFSKTVSSNTLYREEVSFNDQTYTISLTYDPSSTVSIPGYAVANGNSVVVEAAPPGVLQKNTAITVAVVIIALVAVASVLLRRLTR